MLGMCTYQHEIMSRGGLYVQICHLSLTSCTLRRRLERVLPRQSAVSQQVKGGISLLNREQTVS